MAASRLNPTLFDKLVADLEIEGLRENENERRRMADLGGSVMRFYTVPRIERFNEAALRTTVRRELSWLLNTTNLGAVEDLTAGRIGLFGEVETACAFEVVEEEQVFVAEEPR